MGFVELENKGKQIFEQFPAVKRICKRVYQLGMYTLSDEKIKSQGDVKMISPNDEYEYYFGYYDKSPWDANDRYIICLRVRQAYKSVAPKEAGELVLLDTKNDYKSKVIAKTNTWNVQQGCMAQWLGPDFKSHIIYNDYRDGKYCSVVFDIENMKEERVYDCAVYDVAKDASYALSLDFSRLHRMRPGYGYSNIEESTKGELCPDEPCIWKLDLNTGRVSVIKKYTDFKAFDSDDSMDGAEHKVNHLMISPNGSRFMVLHRWFKNGRKHTRLVTLNSDGTDMYNLSDDVFVSHCYWKNNNEILAFLRKSETGNHYYIMEDKTHKYQMFWPELNTDGHCSYSPDGKLIVTDTYPNRKRLASVYICTEKDNKSRRIAQVFAPFRYDNDCRCDLHPRWNHKGDCICIDSVHKGKRGLYIIPLPSVGKEIEKEPETVIPKIIHNVWLGNGKKSKVVEQCIKSWETFLPDYQVMQWDESNVDLNSAGQYVQEAYKEGKWAFVSDYIRLKVLYEYGGIYFDTDMEVLRNIDEFLQLDGFICTESHYSVCTAILAAKPHAMWVKELLDEYKDLIFINSDGSYNNLPNTKRLQRYLEGKYGYSWSDKVQELETGFMIYPSEYFSPLNCYTSTLKMTENTYTFHHYDNTWKSKKDKIKRKVMQLGTRVIGEDNRAKLVNIRKKLR